MRELTPGLLQPRSQREPESAHTTCIALKVPQTHDIIIYLNFRSASSPSMNHCWQLKTSLNAGITPLQPLIKEIKTGSKDDTDISPEDIIVDPKTHHTYRKGRLIGKGGFAKVDILNLFPTLRSLIQGEALIKG